MDSSPHHTKDSSAMVIAKEFFCGLVAGFVSVTICHPLDVIRTRMNIMGGKSERQNSKHKYNNISQTIKTVWREEGWRGFYRGYSITVISIPFFNSIYFPIYNEVKQTLERKYHFGTVLSSMLGAMASGSISNTLTNPIWIMRTRLMVDVLRPVSEQYEGESMWGAYKKMIHEQGYKSLFKGWTISMLGMMHAVVYFPIYQSLKKHLNKSRNQKKLKAWQVLLSSITSKIIASFVTYPHVVIRTIMHDSRHDNLSIVAVTKKIYRQFGIKGFYLGLKADTIRILPSNAIIFLVYELMKKEIM